MLAPPVTHAHPSAEPVEVTECFFPAFDKLRSLGCQPSKPANNKPTRALSLSKAGVRRVSKRPALKTKCLCGTHFLSARVEPDDEQHLWFRWQGTRGGDLSDFAGVPCRAARRSSSVTEFGTRSGLAHVACCVRRGCGHMLRPMLAFLLIALIAACGDVNRPEALAARPSGCKAVSLASIAPASRAPELMIVNVRRVRVRDYHSLPNSNVESIGLVLPEEPGLAGSLRTWELVWYAQSPIAPTCSRVGEVVRCQAPVQGTALTTSALFSGPQVSDPIERTQRLEDLVKTEVLCAS